MVQCIVHETLLLQKIWFQWKLQQGDVFMMLLKSDLLKDVCFLFFLPKKATGEGYSC